MKTILITGGAGFIGSNMCETLLANNTSENIFSNIRGNRVICLDNLSTGNMKNIQHLIDNPHFVFINHDIINPLQIDNNIDEIYNFACPASPEKYQQDPINTLKVNFLGVLNLLELAKIKNAKFLQSSTSEVYGEPEISPQPEEYRGNVNTIGIRSCYDEGKRIAETLVIDFHKKYNVNVRIVRIFNTYGPRMDKNDGRVVSNFINQALNGEPITLYGNGEQTRSFCYIEDQINGLIQLMASNYVYPVNIGNPHEITVKELATIILKLTNSNSKIIYKDLPSDDPTNRKPDITKAKQILNWTPTYDLETGILKTIEYFDGINYL
uniref:UDP-glucuronate decarboxylase n=1 Tax=viral metagenome TaxID=1070528 RepID=A0A6C0KRR3_9ZZZZ